MKKHTVPVTITSLFLFMLFMIGCNVIQEKAADENGDSSPAALARTVRTDQGLEDKEKDEGKEPVSEECQAVIDRFEGVDKESPEGQALIKEYYEVCGKPEYKKEVSEECKSVIARFEGVDKQSPEGQALIKEYYEVCEGKKSETSK